MKCAWATRSCCRNRDRVWEMDKDDESAILNSVKTARAHAEFVLFSIHAHQTAGDVDAGASRSSP